MDRRAGLVCWQTGRSCAALRLPRGQASGAGVWSVGEWVGRAAEEGWGSTVMPGGATWARPEGTGWLLEGRQAGHRAGGSAQASEEQEGQEASGEEGLVGAGEARVRERVSREATVGNSHHGLAKGHSPGLEDRIPPWNAPALCPRAGILACPHNGQALPKGS